MSILDVMFDDSAAQAGLKDMRDNAKGSSLSNVFYRYQNMDFGASTTVRYLPHSGQKLTGDKFDDFWLPKKVIRIRFTNPVKEGSEVSLTIPVMQMYIGGKTENDSILSQVKELYEQAKSEENKGREESAKKIRANASYHWMRGEALAQGFVVRPGFIEQNIPENPIRIFDLKKQIMNVMKAKVNDENPDTMLESWPVHGKSGYNFIIKKTKTADGQYPSYERSEFSPRPSPLDATQIEALKTYDLFTLESFLPSRPTDDEYKLLTEIVKQSIQGDRVWNPDWESHFTTIKVFKTNMGNDTTNSDDIRASIQNIIASKSTDDVASIIAGFNKAGRQIETETTEGEPEIVEAEIVEAEIISVKPDPTVKAQVDTKIGLKKPEEVSSIIARLKSKEKTTIEAVV
jgi:hypothetical protein